MTDDLIARARKLLAGVPRGPWPWRYASAPMLIAELACMLEVWIERERTATERAEKAEAEVARRAQPLEGDWEMRRAREWVKRWGRDPSGTDDLAALLRDCWASGLLDGQAGDDAARAATERAEKAEVQLAGCGAVALDPRQMPDKGAYGWSASLAEVHRVRTDRDEARAEAAALREALVAIRDHRPPPGSLAVQHHVMSIMARDALARFRDLGSE